MQSLFQTAVVFAFVLIPSAAGGQEFDPTVVVSREYEGKLMEVHKPQLKMAVPDSVLRFNLDFDYSITDSPYKGTYEFSPYTVEMKPSMTVRRPGSFHIRAGAGYQLHPVLDLVWSPDFKSPFRMDVYVSHRSFLGKYWNIDGSAADDGTVVLNRGKRGDGTGGSWYGYDFVTNAGVAGKYDWNVGRVRFDVAYDGLQQKDRYGTERSYNAVDAEAGLMSKNTGYGFRYDVAASYRFGEDDFLPTPGGRSSLVGNDFEMAADLGYSLLNGDRMRLDADFGFTSLEGDVFSSAGDLDIVPHYVIDFDRWRFDLGLRFSAAFSTDSFSEMYGYDEQFIYPDVRICYGMVPDAVRLYLDVGGDSRAVSYSDLLRFNRRATPWYARTGGGLLDVHDEKISIALGLEGRVGSRFSYDFRGGYVNYGNALMERVLVNPLDMSLMPAVGYSAYEKAFVAVDWLLDLESLVFDGDVQYTHSWDNPIVQDHDVFLPAALTGSVGFSYTLKKRVTFSADCDFSSARKSLNYKVPGYADLGVGLEYASSRKLSFWLRGGNLLGMTVQRSILHAEKGPYLTAGICLDL